MPKLPDPQKDNIPPNEKLLKSILTDSVANMNRMDMGKLDFGDMFALIMAYGAIFPVLKKYNLLEVDRNGSDG